MFTLPIYNQEGKEVDSVKLNEKIFDGVVNKDALYQAVNSYRANQRKGLAATKTRGEVSGGGKKPWKQKGTGGRESVPYVLLFGATAALFSGRIPGIFILLYPRRSGPWL